MSMKARHQSRHGPALLRQHLHEVRKAPSLSWNAHFKTRDALGELQRGHSLIGNDHSLIQIGPGDVPRGVEIGVAAGGHFLGGFGVGFKL